MIAFGPRRNRNDDRWIADGRLPVTHPRPVVALAALPPVEEFVCRISVLPVHDTVKDTLLGRRPGRALLPFIDSVRASYPPFPSQMRR